MPLLAGRPKIANKSTTCNQHLKLVPYPTHKIDKASAHHAVRRKDRACRDDLGQTITVLAVRNRARLGASRDVRPSGHSH